MTFLPIVDRELRVTARRRGTYWTRLLVAFFAILIGIGISLANIGAPPHQAGEAIFWSLAGLCMIFCLLSGRIATADCLSEEKREGTLGLLFLTDLKGYDIVMGKLVSTSVGALYGLLAVMPVMAVPLLMGGISNGEFWRVALVLVNTFLLSLAIGIFGSAISRDARRAMAANFGLLLLLMFVLPFATSISLSPPFKAGRTVIFSPFYSFYLCEDSRFKLNPDRFWCSIVLVAALTFLLLLLASLLIPRLWQDKPHVSARSQRLTWRGFWQGLSYGKREKLGPYRKRLLDVNAFYWLAARARLKPLHVWIFLLLVAFWWLVGLRNSGILWFDPITAVTLALILNVTLKAWIALEAGQQLAEDQKAGALELLLPTPLTVRDILRGQFLALRRQFLLPLLLTLAVGWLLAATEILHTNPGDRHTTMLFWLAGIMMLMADVVTLPVVAMRVALTAKNPARATLTTIGRVLVLPWALFGLCAGMVNLWIALGVLSNYRQAPQFPGELTYLAMWLTIGIAVDMFFGWKAWRQLVTRFRELATQRFAASSPVRKRVVRRFPARKKVVFALAVIVVSAFSVWLNHGPSLPAPLIVSIQQNNAPLRVFPGYTTFIILPDGSLWRWGGTGYSKKHVLLPGRVDTNNAWLQVAGAFDTGIGVRQDGTLWQLGAPITEISSEHDWVSVSAFGLHAAALKKDGTLWEWSIHLSSGAATKSSLPVQTGTNADWTAVLCKESLVLGLKRDGSIWVWGQWFGVGPVTFSTPTLLCRETNWVSLIDSGLLPQAQNTSGEIWQLDPSLSGPEVSVATAGQLLASNSLPANLITARVGHPELFELRRDGTLWENTVSMKPWFIAADNPQWRQVGKRSDWQSIWSDGIRAFGLTADGVLWIWGVDPGRAGSWNFGLGLAALQERIKDLSSARRHQAWTDFEPPPAIQKTPRPLLRLVAESK